MAYGERLRKLNPLSDECINTLLQSAAPCAQSLLDLACGRGDRLLSLSAAFPEWKLCGFDADRENAKTAAAECTGAEICVGDAAALPYGKNEFDIVLCECSFSLFEKPEHCAAEIARVLRPGGVFLLGDLYAKRNPLSFQRIADNETVKTVYGREVLERYFTAAGLRSDSFFDRSGDLAQMLGQMLLDGTLCECLGREALAEMKKLGTGYGLWLFRMEN